MTARKTKSQWFKAEINLGAVLSVGTVVFFAIVWYATANVTLSNHDKAIDQLTKSLTTLATTLSDNVKHEADARGKVRDEFLAKTEKTNEGIAALNAAQAVSKAQYEQMNSTLVKISDQLTHSAGAASVAGPRR